MQQCAGYDVAFEKPKDGVALERTQVLDPTGGKIVEGPDLMSALEQLLGQMRTDEAGTSCDQNLHDHPSRETHRSRSVGQGCRLMHRDRAGNAKTGSGRAG